MKIPFAALLFILLAENSWSDDTVKAAPAAAPQTGVIIATAEAQVAARRLQTLISQDTELTFPIIKPDEPIGQPDLKIVLGTTASKAEWEQHLPPDSAEAALSPQGFSIWTNADATLACVLGGEVDGLRYGVGEFWHCRCQLDGKRVLPQPLCRVVKAPAFSKRMFWNWTHCTNWDDDLARVHQTKHVDEHGTLEPYLAQPKGFTETFEKVIDFQADHKLNGLIVWGLINDAHGGLAAAQHLSRYARDNGVRILPGIGTMGYGGFYFGGDHPLNINTFLKTHPQVRLMVLPDGKDMPGTPCPSDPVFQQWLKDGAQWYFSTLKDIGGVNLEHGDFFECHCPRCRELRSRPENDASYHWDMMTTQVPVIDAGLKLNPDLWFTYATYDGYDAKWMTQPPKFLRQFPPEAVAQWTYTKMVADPILNPAGSWPRELRAPEGARHSVGLLHQGSHWDVERQWWGRSAKSDVAFGGTYSLICDLIRQACRRAIDDGSEGLELVGQIGAASPQNELNYLALESFSWNPQLEMESWIDVELAPLYGGKELSRRFYEMVSNTTEDPQAIALDLRAAQEVARTLPDSRQARRWQNLVRELQRRRALKQ